MIQIFCHYKEINSHNRRQQIQRNKKWMNGGSNPHCVSQYQLWNLHTRKVFISRIVYIVFQYFYIMFYGTNGPFINYFIAILWYNIGTNFCCMITFPCHWQQTIALHRFETNSFLIYFWAGCDIKQIETSVSILYWFNAIPKI